jgi:hypothetical protein
VSTKNGTRPEPAVFGRAVVSAPSKETDSFTESTRERLTLGAAAPSQPQSKTSQAVSRRRLAPLLRLSRAPEGQQDCSPGTAAPRRAEASRRRKAATRSFPCKPTACQKVAGGRAQRHHRTCHPKSPSTPEGVADLCHPSPGCAKLQNRCPRVFSPLQPPAACCQGPRALKNK